MSQVIINDIPPYTQAVATGGQTVFGTNWTANYASDVVVYVRPAGSVGNDALYIIPYPASYSVAFIGGSLEVQVTLVNPSTAGDIVTITRQTPADRENLYNNTNFLPSMLNNDFGILTLVDQQAQLVNQLIGPRYNYSSVIVPIVDTILPILGANEGWVKNSNNTAIIPYTFPSSGIAPAGDTYVTVTDETATLPNSLPLSAVGDGIMVNKTSTGQILARSITGTSSQISVLNSTGVGGNINISIADNAVMPGTAGMGLPQGTTAQRVIPVTGIGLRYNTTIGEVEYWDGSSWAQLESNTHVNPGLINELAWYAASGTQLSGLTTGNDGVLVTSPTGVPSISSTLPAGLTIPGYAHSGVNNDITSMTGLTGTLKYPTGIVDSNNNLIIQFSFQAAAVNYWRIYNSPTGSPVLLQANGTDASIPLSFNPQNDDVHILDHTNTINSALRWYNAAGTFYVGFRAPTLAASTIWNLPATDGTANQILKTDGSGNLGFASFSSYGAALTKLDDTNVTLTLGGSPSTALVNAASLTLGWTGVLSPARGGTGVNNGTSTFTIGGNFQMAGAFTFTGTLTANTAVTFPTTGTLATLSDIPSVVPAALTKVDDTNVTLTLGGSPSTALLQATSLSLGWTGQLAVGRGGTGVSSVTISPTASSFAGWDANKNFSADSFISGYTTTATAAGTTTLTVDSTQQQFFTGSTTQTVVLPVTSTLVLGQEYYIVNSSSGVVTVQSSGGNTVQAMAAGSSLRCQCILTSGTTAASWHVDYPLNGSSGTVNTGTINYLAYYASTGNAVSGLTTPASGVLTSVTSTPTWASQLGLSLGGTNANLTASNGGIFYSTSTAGAILAGTATAGLALLSGASTTPSWSATAPLLTGGGTMTGNIAFNPTTAGITGTTTNDDAAAGTVGEFISSNIVAASAVSLTTATAKNITSISLTAGDWDVDGNVSYTPSGGNPTVYAQASSSTSATLPDFSLYSAMSISGMGGCGFAIPPRRYSLSGTTTVYLVGYATFAAGTCTACGNIRARRAR